MLSYSCTDVYISYDICTDIPSAVLMYISHMIYILIYLAAVLVQASWRFTARHLPCWHLGHCSNLWLNLPNQSVSQSVSEPSSDSVSQHVNEWPLSESVSQSVIQ